MQSHEYRAAMIKALDSHQFTHFVTLTTNGGFHTRAQMRTYLKDWDARTSRFLIGPKWHKRPQERPFWIAFPEMPAGNPHWHLLVRLDDSYFTGARVRRLNAFPYISDYYWRQVVRRGEAHVGFDISNRTARYVTKDIGIFKNMEHYVISG